MMARQALVVCSAAGLIAVLGMGAAWGYKEARFRRHLALAHERVQQNRAAEAIHFVQFAHNQRPNHPAVIRAMADITAALQSPDHVHWLEKLAEALPNDRNVALELASARLKAGQVAEAMEAAEALAVHPAQRGAAENLLGIAAQREGRPEEAETHFRRAVEAAPQNPAFLANLIAHLMSDKPGSVPDREVESLINRLEQLPGGRLAAARQRVVFLESRDRSREALAEAARLVALPGAPVEDWIRQLELTALHQREAYPSFRTEVFGRALKTPADSLTLLSWLVERGAFADAREFAARLPANHTQFPPLVLAVAEMHRRTAQWKPLEELVDGASWKGIEAYRFAYAAALAASQKRPPEALRVIQMQAIQSSTSPNQLYAILRLTADWPGWAKAQEPILIHLSSRVAWRYAALQGLASIYLNARQSAPLAQVEKSLWQMRPESREHRLRFASLALLNASQVGDAAPAIETLSRDYPKDPRVVYLAARYDLFLKRPGKAAERIEALPQSLRLSRAFALFTAQIYASLPDRASEARQAWKKVDSAQLIDAELVLWKELGKELAQPMAQASAY